MENINYIITDTIKKLTKRMFDKATFYLNVAPVYLPYDSPQWHIADDIWDEVHSKVRDDVHSKVLTEIKKELTDGKY
jgi:hypothetical protein